MPDVDRDDWGFAAADHDEFRALRERHAEALPELMRAVFRGDVPSDDPRMIGVTPQPDDPGIMGWIASECPADENTSTRVFGKGAFWLALLTALRTLDEKGGA